VILEAPSSSRHDIRQAEVDVDDRCQLGIAFEELSIGFDTRGSAVEHDLLALLQKIRPVEPLQHFTVEVRHTLWEKGFLRNVRTLNRRTAGRHSLGSNDASQ
jgi:hypothetical protein